jgi:hypothetical protein
VRPALSQPKGSKACPPQAGSSLCDVHQAAQPKSIGESEVLADLQIGHSFFLFLIFEKGRAQHEVLNQSTYKSS